MLPAGNVGEHRSPARVGDRLGVAEAEHPRTAGDDRHATVRSNRSGRVFDFGVSLIVACLPAPQQLLGGRERIRVVDLDEPILHDEG